MNTFAAYYLHGGVFMHFITVIGAAGVAVALACLVRRSRGFAVLALGIGTLTIVTGMIGMMSAYRDVERAIADVPAEGIEAARARGYELSEIPLEYAIYVSVPAWIGGLVGGLLSTRQVRSK